MRPFRKLERYDAALNKVLERVDLLDDVIISVEKSLGMVTAEDVLSKIDIPPWDISAVDGYAVKSDDVVLASYDTPVKLKVVGSSMAGKPFRGAVSKGKAVKIATGAVIPKGADTVVMAEYTEEKNGELFVYTQSPPGKNISKRGRVLRTGETVIEKGRFISPVDYGLMLQAGVESVRVRRRPRILIFSIGDELVDSASDLRPGYTVETNRRIIGRILSRYGIVDDLGILPDRVDEIAKAVTADGYDLSISFSGTSVGERDLVRQAVEESGEVVVHGVSQKPGKPLLAGVIGGRLHLGLPGFPVSTLMCFSQFVIPVLYKMLGVRDEWPRYRLRVTLAESVACEPGVRCYVRVKIRDGEAYPLTVAGSDMLTSVSSADGILIVETDVEGYAKGEMIEVIPIDEFLGLR